MSFTSTLLVLTISLTNTMAQAPSYSPAMAAAIQGGNMEFAGTCLVVLAVIAFVLLAYRIVLSGIRHTRQMSSLESTKQTYWRRPTGWFAGIKKHIIYAPLFQKRHSSELRLSRRWSIGILPTRFQSIFLILLIIANVVYCVVGIEWNMVGTPLMLVHWRNRTGSIAVSNLVPLFLFAGRNNPFIVLLNIPYDSFNMMHRWLGRIIAVEAIIHASCYISNGVITGGWKSVQISFTFYGHAPQLGLIAICALLAIILTATTVFRRAFYELWHHIHIILVILVTVALWYHLEDLPQQNFIKAFIAGWVIERIIRLGSLLYRNVGAGGTHATVEYLPGDAVKVSLSIARPWTFRPGQHMFIAIPAIALWTTHPFSLAWSDETHSSRNALCSNDPEKDAIDSSLEKEMNTAVHAIPPQEITFSSNGRKQVMSAIIRRRAGFTSALYNRLQKTSSGRFSARAFVEGPYGGSQSLASYGTVLLFAGGVGITHQVAYLRSLISGYAESSVACRRLLLVWTIQSPEHLEWIRPWMTEVLAMDGRRQILRVQLYISRPRHASEIQSPSATVTMFPGRPDVAAIVKSESHSQIGAMAVSVCGPGALGDDVRKAVREVQNERSVDLVEEAFGW